MLISVVMPSYNHQAYCIAAAESVLSQSYHAVELIVVDDGSRDRSVELLSSIRDSRLKLVVQENQGAHAAINRGLSLAQGDYLSIINSDDTFDLDRFKKLLDFMESKQSDFVCSWIRIVDAEGKSKAIKEGWCNMRPLWAASSAELAYWRSDNFSLNLLSSNFVSTTSNMIFRRHVYDDIGGMRNLRFSHDWDFILRVASKFKCSICPEALINYRLHGKNTITSNREWMLFEVVWTVAANIHRFYGKDLFSVHSSTGELISEVKSFFNSVNLGDLDKLFWILLNYLNSRRLAIGDEAADNELLENTALRQAFIDLIPRPASA